MKISDANPIQFWVNGVLTFNEKIDDGVVGQYFEQIFNSSDVIRIQFSDSSFLSYSLIFVDQVTLLPIPTAIPVYNFTLLGSDNVWEINFNAFDLSIKKVGFFIVGELTTNRIYPPTNTLDLTTFINADIPGSGSYFSGGAPGTGSWTLGAAPNKTTNPVIFTKFLVGIFETKSGRDYEINYSINNGASGASVWFLFLDKNFHDSVDTSGFATPDLTGAGVLTGSVTRTTIADGKYLAVIVEGSGVVNVTTINGLSISQWSDEAHGIANYSSKTATTLVKTVAGSTTPMGAWQYLSVPMGNAITFNLTLTVVGTLNSGLLEVAWQAYTDDKYGAGVNVGSDGFSPPGVGAGVYHIPVTIYPTGNVKRLYIQLFTPSTPSSATVTVTLDDVGKIIYFDRVTYLAKSDTVDIADAHENSRYIQYANKSNFAGLGYTNGEIFHCRLTGKFFQQRFPTVSESEDITDGEVVKLSGTIKKQKYFEVEPAPLYIHEKLILILMSNTVNIDGELYVMEESYDVQLMDERFPFYLGKVWLTKQDSFKSNVYGNLTSI